MRPPVLAVYAAMLTFASQASAQPAQMPMPCGERAQLLEELGHKFEETLSGSGLAADGFVFELLISPEGSWTLLRSSPQGQSCVAAVGEAWQELKLRGEPS